MENFSQISKKELNELPIINFIIPAWKEGENYKLCLESLFKIPYPYIKIITNAGGNEETLNIASQFQNFNNFKILHQKSGGGKLKAINDALECVNEGLVFLIDADIILTEEIFYKMVYEVINKSQDVVFALLKPHHSQKKNDLVKYIYINRMFTHFTRRYEGKITPCTCLKYKVVKSIGKFPEKKLYPDGKLMGLTLAEKGFKISFASCLTECFNYPDTLRKYFNQNIRWIQNSYIRVVNTREKRFLFKVIIAIPLFIYILIFPVFYIINFGLFMIGIYLLIYLYLGRIRKVILFKLTSNSNFYGKFHPFFYLKLLFYIYIDSLINLYSFLEFYLLRKKGYKKRKNIETEN
ncbi:MAG: glycosyltransferase [Promethearchaeota archaeon]